MYIPLNFNVVSNIIHNDFTSSKQAIRSSQALTDPSFSHCLYMLRPARFMSSAVPEKSEDRGGAAAAAAVAAAVAGAGDDDSDIDALPSQRLQLQQLEERHLDWSDRQRRILTADGRAEDYYAAERGFAFREDELPHHYVCLRDDDDDGSSGDRNDDNNATRRVFREWAQRRQATTTTSSNDEEGAGGEEPTANRTNPVVGAWKRPLFYGGWEHTTDRDERVYNLQSQTLFVDLRVPLTRDEIFGGALRGKKAVSSLDDLDGRQLRWYARQHVFSGFSDVHCVSNVRERPAHVAASSSSPSSSFAACCTRHHCIDWNFVGAPRSRPNKWWIEFPQRRFGGSSPSGSNNNSSSVWKEWAFAKDEKGHHYYCERWQRLEGDGVAASDGKGNSAPRPSVYLALRKTEGRDGVIVVVGDHFNYCLGRRGGFAAAGPNNDDRNAERRRRPGSSLVDLVDAAVARGDLDAARRWLDVEGGHGRVSTGWTLDCAIEFWKEGSRLWTTEAVVVEQQEEGASSSSSSKATECRVLWNGEPWEVFETSLSTASDLGHLLTGSIAERDGAGRGKKRARAEGK